MSRATRGRGPFPLIRQPHRQPRLARAAWAGVTAALWIVYAAFALPLALPWLDAAGGAGCEPLDWLAYHRWDLTVSWTLAVAAVGASLLLVAWAELERARPRRRLPPRLADAHAAAIARRLHASRALQAQVAAGKIVRLRLDESARPVSAEALAATPQPGREA
ncbi:poly-beta-1,6-N-acetyl-D-glucosamine biosynthesis protein PgaD [Stenotrophomonas sp. HITSZ_GD]|uniref:poly-beta-1,6-N-acetyl-D-glucosamine biosynthesis protein PgaD n=1 Tax=Stenotrophomonas sp. HITSZ_GD TaxID=3037248 RepID=UPI00240D3CEA|nr:poly-beta-1,6-N-acetyl-D-glucosamine biosynthesis protein PgaD [Stenotrophomonas sp. HITSZ_GD]MDG2526456.1 poly-beta-1,6-N-acetyl-D-glucosamine biosynthesis protein PgaD [Stenotrophomonas sp. HITSZ_GD]